MIIMKYVRSIGLFFVYSLICLVFGILIGQSLNEKKTVEQQEVQNHDNVVATAPPVIINDEGDKEGRDELSSEHDVMNQSALAEMEQIDFKQTEDGPETGYFISLYNHYVVVYHSDQKTIFLFTDMKAEELPDDVQKDLVKGIFMKDEGELYDFLENYTS